MRNERRRNEDARRIITEQRYWGDVQLAKVDEEEETMQREQNFVTAGSVKPATATLDLHVISVPKAKKKTKKKK